ncbi:MAG: hypothetical protein KDI65_11540 [Alphaproteobacteria bacterium]|nr:hypothetical protein [Alphaproteobacteria bacterium]
MRVPEGIRKAFDRIFGPREPEGMAPGTVSVDRKDLTLCVIDEFDTSKKTNAFIADRWAGVAQLMEEAFTTGREISERETYYVDAVRTVEQAIRQAGTFDARIDVSRSAIDTLVNDGDLAYAAKNIILAKVGGWNDEEEPEEHGPIELTQADIENDLIPFPGLPERDQELLTQQNALAMFALKSRNVLDKYSSNILPYGHIASF